MHVHSFKIISGAQNILAQAKTSEPSHGYGPVDNGRPTMKPTTSSTRLTSHAQHCYNQDRQEILRSN